MKVTITQKLSGTCCFSDIVITILSAQQRTINWSKTCFGKLNSSSHSKSYACCDTNLLRFYLRGKQTNRNNNNILGVGRQHRARHNAGQHVSLPHFICLSIWIYKLLFAIPPITPFSLKCDLVAGWHSHCDGHCAWVKLFPCGHGQGALVYSWSNFHHCACLLIVKQQTGTGGWADFLPISDSAGSLRCLISASTVINCLSSSLRWK